MTAPAERREVSVLIAAIFIAGLCSIVYELLISTASSYFLGDSVKQFSITIGLYMGLGAYLSRLLKEEILAFFIALEILLGFLGGLSVPLLYFCYTAFADSYVFAMVLLILAIGTLIGLINMLITLQSNPGDVGIGLAIALTTTFYGLALANMLFGPISEKIKERAENNLFIETMQMEAVLMLYDKRNYVYARDKLAAYLNAGSRKKLNDHSGNGFLPKISDRKATVS